MLLLVYCLVMGVARHFWENGSVGLEYFDCRFVPVVLLFVMMLMMCWDKGCAR